MKRSAFILILSLLFNMAHSQKNSSLLPQRLMNNVEVNLLGDGSNVSMNYERWIRLTDYLFIIGKVGGGYGKEITLSSVVDSIAPQPPLYYTIPAGLTVNAGKGRHFGEAGIGATVNIGDVSPHLIYYLTAGYRLQPLKSGNMSLRVFGHYPLSTPEEFRNVFFVPFGLSFGIAF